MRWGKTAKTKCKDMFPVVQDRLFCVEGENGLSRFSLIRIYFPDLLWYLLQFF